MLDFEIDTAELGQALAALFALKANAKVDLVDITVEGDELQLVTSGTEISAAVATKAAGTARVPTALLQNLKASLSTFEDSLHIRVMPGEIRLNRSVLRHAQISLRDAPRRIVGVPAEASPFDLVSLRELYSYEELNDSDLWERVHQAEKTMKAEVQRAADLLTTYGVPAQETFALVESKRADNAEVLRKVLAAE